MQRHVQDETGRFIPVAPGWEIRVQWQNDDGKMTVRGPQPMVGWLLVDDDGGDRSYAPAVFGHDGFLEAIQVDPADNDGWRIDTVDVLVTGGGDYETLG